MFELAMTTSTILEEVKRPESTQCDVAAIIERWSQSGLERIKEAAWKGEWRGVPFGVSA